MIFACTSTSNSDSTMKSYAYKGLTIRVGCNAEENWKLLATNRKYTWVHLDGAPSAHAILELEEEPSSDELEFARACILAQTKKASPKATIIYAKVGRCKRGSKPGEVIIMRR